VSQKRGANLENQNIYYSSSDLHLGDGKFTHRAVVQNELSFMSQKMPVVLGDRTEDSVSPDLQPVEEKFTHRQVVQDGLSFVSQKRGANLENQNIYYSSSDLHLGDGKFTHRAVVQNELSFMSKKMPALRGRRVVHFRLPDEDIWLLSLEAAECLLRRQPVGIVLEKIFIQP
ncbi:MAG: hypothetical protein IJQ85_01495, partial [Selenomonadaceae bacterium]|nr:hypothetical protein [Selenomonadaceae bacterium]